MTDSNHREREHFFSAAKLIAALTLLSRVFGLLRAMAISSLGVVRANDAFAMAFRIPNFFRRLFGEGALSAAFVPVFTETQERDGPEAADKLLNNALGLLAAFLIVLLAAILTGLWVWGTCWPGGADRQLLIGLTAAMLPFMVTVCVLALCSAALNCRGHFSYPAYAPVLLNIVMIAAAWLVAPRWAGDLQGQLYIVAASVSVAGLLQTIGALVLLRRSGFSARPRLWPLQPGVRAIVRTMAPMLLGLGLLQLTELIESAWAWVLTATEEAPTLHIAGQTLAKPLSQGVLVRLDAARFLYQFPLGVLANSLAVAVFPLLSRYSARGDWGNLRDSLNRAIRLSTMEGLAAGVGLLVLAEPITQLLFVRGGFSADDARRAAFILQMYVLGMWAYCTYQIFVRAFYSLKDTVTPLRVSCGLMVLELLLVGSLVWTPGLGEGAFGLTAAIVFTLNTSVLAWLLRRRLGLLGGRMLARSALRTAVACALMAGALLAIRYLLTPWGHLPVVAVGVPVGAGVFGATMKILKAPELGELLGAIRNRRAKVSDEESSTPPPEKT